MIITCLLSGSGVQLICKLLLEVAFTNRLDGGNGTVENCNILSESITLQVDKKYNQINIQ